MISLTPHSEEDADDEDFEAFKEQTVFDRTVLLDSSRSKSFKAAGKDPKCTIVGSGGSHLSGGAPANFTTQPHPKLRLLTTGFLFAAFVAAGIGVSIVGPTLLDLAHNVGVDVNQIASLFPARSGGYLVGSIVGGCLADSADISCSMALPLLICAVSSTFIPWMSHTWTVGITITIKGFGSGMLDTVGNVFALRLWPNSPPTIHALHFFFALGAFAAPLLAEPFLVSFPKTLSSLNGSSLAYSRNDSGSQLSHILHPIHGSPLLHRQYHLTFNTSSVSNRAQLSTPAVKAIGAPPPFTPMGQGKDDSQDSVSAATSSGGPSPGEAVSRDRPRRWANDLIGTLRNSSSLMGNYNESLSDVAANLVEAFLDAALHQASNVETPYLIVGASYFLLFLCFLSLCCFRARSLRMMASAGKPHDEGERELTDAGMALLDGEPHPSSKRATLLQRRRREGKGKEEKAFKIRVLVLLFLFYALYVGLEVTYGGFILTYAVRGPPKMNKDRAAFLTSVFWGCFSVGRLLGIPLSRLLSPTLLLLLDVFLTCVSAMGLVISGRKIPSILWVCSGTLGFGMSSICACGINWAEQYISLTGKATALLVVAAATGEMIVPIVVGQLFESKGPISLMYVVLFIVIAAGVIFLLLLRLAIGRKPFGQRRGSSATSGRGGGGGGGSICDDSSNDFETSSFLSDMETFDGGVTANNDGDVDRPSRIRNEKTSLFDKLRSSNLNNGHRPRSGNAKKVTFKLHDPHEYRKLTS